MRKRIFEVIEVAGDQDRVSRAYDIIMMAAIVISIIPLMSKETSTAYETLNEWR